MTNSTATCIFPIPSITAGLAPMIVAAPLAKTPARLLIAAA